MREISGFPEKKICVKMKKAEREGTLRTQQCPDIKSRKIADLSENSPKYRKPVIFKKKLSAFFRFVRSVSPASPHLRRASGAKPPNRFSVIQLSNITKTKKRRLFQFYQRTFASPLLKQFLSSTNSLIFGFGSGNDAAPAFLNLLCLRAIKAAEARLIFCIIKTDTQSCRQTSI
jgi:hypothetical protein